MQSVLKQQAIYHIGPPVTGQWHQKYCKPINVTHRQRRTYKQNTITSYSHPRGRLCNRVTAICRISWRTVTCQTLRINHILNTYW